VSIVGNFIKERATNAQFIIISLRSQMFELADRLCGIYKTDNATKSVTINPAKVAARCGLLREGEGEGVGAADADAGEHTENRASAGAAKPPVVAQEDADDEREPLSQLNKA